MLDICQELPVGPDDNLFPGFIKLTFGALEGVQVGAAFRLVFRAEEFAATQRASRWPQSAIFFRAAAR
jgi:hypothetical protein